MPEWPLFVFGVFVTCLLGFTVWMTGRLEGEEEQSRMKAREAHGRDVPPPAP